MSTHRLNQQIQKKDERVDSLGQEHFDLQNTLTKYNTYLSEVMKIENPKEIVTTALGFLEIKLQEIEEGSELDFTLLNRIEVFLDRLFEKFDLDIEFTHHFYDRLNDPRNGKKITALANPTSANDAANKAYVDNAVANSSFSNRSARVTIGLDIDYVQVMDAAVTESSIIVVTPETPHAEGFYQYWVEPGNGSFKVYREATNSDWTFNFFITRY